MRLSARNAVASLAVAAVVASSPISRASAPADTWSPLRVHLQCQQRGRTRACPAFLRALIDDNPLLAYSPRAGAQLVLYFNATGRANHDLANLRFSAQDPDLPDRYEVTQVLDTRSSDDYQRAQLKPAFERGIAVYLSYLIPEAVTVILTPPVAAKIDAPETSPWGFSVGVGGNGRWTNNFKSASVWGDGSASRITDTSKLFAVLAASRWLSRQPPLIIEDQEVSLDAEGYGVEAQAGGARLLDAHLSVGALARGGHQDPDGQYRATARVHGGLAYDWFASDDPRGNVLSFAYLIGVQHDHYNIANVLDQKRATFGSHMVLAQGSVRSDRTSYGVRAVAIAQLDAPRTRYVLDLAPSLSMQVGDHLDIGVSFNVTKQALPGPRDLDQGSFGAVSRSSYAEPLAVGGHLSLRYHWDRDNEAQNNRFGVNGQLRPLSPL